MGEMQNKTRFIWNEPFIFLNLQPKTIFEVRMTKTFRKDTERCKKRGYDMNKCLMMVAAVMMAATSLQAQTERSDDFKAKYELKEVVVMSRHNIRSPLTSGGAAYMRVTPYEWFKWTSPSSQLSQRGGVLETEMGPKFCLGDWQSQSP